MLAITALLGTLTQPPPASAAPSTFPLVPIVVFIALLLALLALDLGVLNRKAHVIRAGEAMMWTGFWVTLALLFGGAVFLAYDNHWYGLGISEIHVTTGREALVQYVTGYLVEQSLSLDNIFVIATIFAYFRVPPQFQHRVLFWGIIGVILMRGGMIAGGAALIAHFDWSVYLFGAILFYSAVKMLALDTENVDIEGSRVVRLGRKLFPIHPEYEGQRFFLRIGGRLHATPLFLVLLMVETADAVFALDSIPAIFAVTKDPFIVFTSNVFAILGLRSLYFALAAIVHKFRYLNVSLAFLLAFVGVKMVLSHYYEIDPIASLAIIGGILGLGIVASLVADRRTIGAADAGGDDRESP
ncbi:MAG: TerC family protein [Phycisphaerales bacterium]|nr:TerC family protein [Phycisphaerales bacterium]